MKAQVAGVDEYRWVDDDGEIQSAAKGETIEVSDKEFERAQKMSANGALEYPALVKPGSKDAKAAAAADDSEETTPEAATEAAFPGTHAELDALAKSNKLTWPEGTKTVAEKHAALTAAGVQPPSE